jgi:hypothetical protein
MCTRVQYTAKYITNVWISQGRWTSRTFLRWVNGQTGLLTQPTNQIIPDRWVSVNTYEATVWRQFSIASPYLSLYTNSIGLYKK